MSQKWNKLLSTGSVARRRLATISAGAWTKLILGTAAFLSFTVAVSAMYDDNTPEVFAFLFATFFFAVLAVPNAIEQITLPLGIGLKTRLQEIRTTLEESKILAKQLARVGLYVIYSAHGFLPDEDDQIRDIDKTRDDIFSTLERIGIPALELREVIEFDRRMVCELYFAYIQSAAGKRFGTDAMAAAGKAQQDCGLEHLPPEQLERAYRERGALDDELRTLVGDYRHYYETGQHRSIERWSVRHRW